MTETSKDSIRLRRLLAEGFMVVISILIAFALDAWWDQRQLEEDIREDLIIVEAELAENIRLTGGMQDLMSRVIEAGTAITDVMFTQADADQVEVRGDWVYWGLFNHPTLDLSLGAIDAWIATGRVAGISNPELRKRLASVRGKVADVVEEQAVARELGSRDLYPLLTPGMDDIRPLVNVFADGLSQRQKVEVYDIPEMHTMTIPNTPELRLLLQSRIIWYLAASAEMGDFQQELEGIQELLQQELRK